MLQLMWDECTYEWIDDRDWNHHHHHQIPLKVSRIRSVAVTVEPASPLTTEESGLSCCGFMGQICRVSMDSNDVFSSVAGALLWSTAAPTYHAYLMETDMGIVRKMHGDGWGAKVGGGWKPLLSLHHWMTGGGWWCVSLIEDVSSPNPM